LDPDIEKILGVATPPLLREHPFSTLYDAAKLLIQTHARRLPLLENDTATGHEVIVSVLTQYRLLKFISINVRGYLGRLQLLLTVMQTVSQRNPKAPYFTPKTQDRYLRLGPSSGRQHESLLSHCHCDANNSCIRCCPHVL
jgi:5'-AMP-activated protein kinase regulatory gamma subunit